MTCWLIEDEPPALRRLQKLIAAARPGWAITHTADTIEATRHALATLPHPDVIFSDIHLADGLAFSIWETGEYAGNIIFTTAYDQYALRAFRVNSIDYLLKPISETELERSLSALESRQAQLAAPDWQQLARLVQNKEPVYRERFLVQKGPNWVPVRVEDLRQLYSKDGSTFALSTAGTRYLLTDALDRLAEELDPAKWYRINRSQIIHIDSVEQAAPYFNHRLSLRLSPAGEGENLVSRQRVKGFRGWLGG
ncbi:LytTR family DNA-binding domain-containing protein [Lewinella sp. 4G2]|uniref:LytR/AlgR family response regulator transcription factor n=1 Tax=Lewinella sp. 4G2 TaxID=1803372 RepID=UPI0007E19C13|nr:LytTR family DNA-binding domain-containing protein [Lewinella sp. 4G2]OAV42574.1 hypothetical protein A3850_015110 [Lewinella sp. 4G2]